MNPESHGEDSDKGEESIAPGGVIGRGANEEDDPVTWETSHPLETIRQSNGAPAKIPRAWTRTSASISAPQEKK